MTPLEIEVLLHCHCSPAPHDRRDAPAVKQALDFFCHTGLIIPVADYYETTDRGIAHVKQLCDLPYPESVWVNHKKEIIEI